MSKETRKIQKFLFLPKRINNQTKWLIKAIWEEERHEEAYFNWFNPIFGDPIKVWSKWKPTKFR